MDIKDKIMNYTTNYVVFLELLDFETTLLDNNSIEKSNLEEYLVVANGILAKYNDSINDLNDNIQSKVQKVLSNFFLINNLPKSLLDEILCQFKYSSNYIFMNNQIVFVLSDIFFKIDDYRDRVPEDVYQDLYQILTGLIVSSIEIVLLSLCSCIAFIQFESLITGDIRLKGAISYGELYFDEVKKQLIGKSYIEAYELAQLEKNPRVVIHDSLLKTFGEKNINSLIKKIEKEYAIFNKLFFSWEDSKLDKDVISFIDYLGYIKHEEPSMIEKHKKFWNDWEEQYFNEVINM